MTNDFNPETNYIIIPFSDERTNDIYYYVLSNIKQLKLFIKEILIDYNELFIYKNNIKRYNLFNYFICMDNNYKHKEGYITEDEFKNENTMKFYYNNDINISINYNYRIFNESDKIIPKYVKCNLID